MGEHAITIKLGVRRMFCDNALCKRHTFTERLPSVAAPWAKVSKVPLAKQVGSQVFPERTGRSDAGHSRLDAWRHIVLEHWTGDRRNSRKVFHDLQQRGYRGSYPTLARYLRRLRAAGNVVAASGLPASARPTLDAAPRQVLTPRTAAWTVLRRAEKPNMESRALLAGMHAALSLDWSNGQTESQIHRLKTIKRQMYGRAGLDLPERRFLLAA